MLVRVLIGILDHVLKGGQESFDEAVANRAIETVFAVYVQSGIDDAELLDRFLPTWTYNASVLNIWLRISTALFKRLVYILYKLMARYNIESKTTPKTALTLDADFINTSCVTVLSPGKKQPVLSHIFNLSDDHTIFLFFHFSTLLLRSKHVKVSCKSHFLTLMHTFCSVNEFDYSKPVEVQSFGDTMEANAQSRGPACNKEYSESIKDVLLDKSEGESMTLGKNLVKFFGIKIFKGNYVLTAKFLTSFPGPYSYPQLAYLYKIMRSGLKSLKQGHDERSLVEFLAASSKIFTSNLYGAHILFLGFIDLSKNVTKYNKNVQLVGFYLIILFHILVLILNITSCDLKAIPVQTGKHLTIVQNIFTSHREECIRCLKDMVRKYNSLPNEKSNCPFEWLYKFWWVDALIDILAYSPEERCRNLVDLLERNFADKFFAEWTEATATAMLISLEIAETVIESTLCEQTGNDWEDQLHKVLQLLLKCVEESVTSLRTGRKPRPAFDPDRVVCAVVRVIVVAMSVKKVRSEAIVKQIVGVLDKCKEVEKNANKKAKFLVETVESALNSLTLDDLHKPFSFDNSIMRSTIISNDSDYPFEQDNTGKPQFIFLVGGQIVTMTQLPKRKGAYSMAMEVRNANGLFVYRGEMITSKETLSKNLAFKNSRSVGSSRSSTREDARREAKLNDTFPGMANERPVVKGIPNSKVLELLKAESHNESQYLEGKIEEVAVIKSDDFRLKSSESKALTIRMFLHHFRPFISQGAKLILNTEDAKTLIKEIDEITLKGMLFIPLLYLKTPSSDHYNTNTSTDPQFNSFMTSLGTVLKDSHIRTGNFDSIADIFKDVGIVHFPARFTDLVFLCPSLHSEERLQLINSSMVLVVWNACRVHSQDSRPPAYLHSVFNVTEERIVILITPMRNNLFRINILTSVDSVLKSSKDLGNV